MNVCFKPMLMVSLLLTSSTLLAASTEMGSGLMLSDCHLDGIKEQVKCGTLQVPENYNNQDTSDTNISINFAVLPAIDNSDKKTPLMFLAGGPGQASVELATMLRTAFYDIRKTHDIILVDQRGTGKSHPLQCGESVEKSVYEMIPEDFSEQEIKDCIAGFTGDLSQYNSENAIRDFDAVRAALGHKQINLYGGSYGTRAGLVYMRMFPESIRSIVLDGVAPIEVPIGLFGHSSAQSFQLLLSHCEQELACHKAYPDLLSEFKQLIALFEKSPVILDIQHPRLGTSTKFVVSKSKFIGTIFQQLYSVPMRSLVPLVIHQAFLGNYHPLAGLISGGDGEQPVYIGLFFNISCNEDFPKITPEMFIQDADNHFGGNNSQQSFNLVCPIWPPYRPSEAFYQPVTATIPTLILSGGFDPVTPPSNGEITANTLPNSHHIIVDNVGHIVATSTCAVEIIKEFMSTLDPKNLDESCLKDVPVESFMTSLNGGN